MKARLTFTESQKKALKVEMARQLEELQIEESSAFDALLLLTLNQKYGFGKKRLRKFYDDFNEMQEEVRKYYCCEPANTYEGQESLKYYATDLLKKVGVDVELWNEQRECWVAEKDEVWCSHK